jgi:hypothetical protein
VSHLNQVKVLPEGDVQALLTSVWLEEIEAQITAALGVPFDD